MRKSRIKRPPEAEDCSLCRGSGTNVSVTGSQLLHLSARTRCRWSLRFQISYLTLLLRRTNRSGPVDFLPRIFAEVTALRHQVMPYGDRFRSIQIGVDLIAAIAAFEFRLIRTDTQMQTSRTGLRRIPWVDIYDLHSHTLRLVADHLLKFGKTPFVNAFRLAGLTNPVEVFKNDPLIVRFRLSHDLFTDAVIGVRDKTPLTTRDTLERSERSLAAVGLERSSRPFVAGFFVANILRRVELVVRCHRYAVEAEVDAETALWLFNFRRRDRDRNMQVE